MIQDITKKLAVFVLLGLAVIGLAGAFILVIRVREWKLLPCLAALALLAYPKARTLFKFMLDE